MRGLSRDERSQGWLDSRLRSLLLSSNPTPCPTHPYVLNSTPTSPATHPTAMQVQYDGTHVPCSSARVSEVCASAVTNLRRVRPLQSCMWWNQCKNVVTLLSPAVPVASVIGTLGLAEAQLNVFTKHVQHCRGQRKLRRNMQYLWECYRSWQCICQPSTRPDSPNVHGGRGPILRASRDIQQKKELYQCHNSSFCWTSCCTCACGQTHSSSATRTT